MNNNCLDFLANQSTTWFSSFASLECSTSCTAFLETGSSSSFSGFSTFCSTSSSKTSLLLFFFMWGIKIFDIHSRKKLPFQLCLLFWIQQHHQQQICHLFYLKKHIHTINNSKNQIQVTIILPAAPAAPPAAKAPPILPNLNLFIHIRSVYQSEWKFWNVNNYPWAMPNVFTAPNFLLKPAAPILPNLPFLKPFLKAAPIF